MYSRPVLGHEEITHVLGAVRKEVQRQGWAVSIVAADDDGHSLVLERLDGYTPIGIYIAAEKARSAALRHRGTRRYEDMIGDGCSVSLSAPLSRTTLEGDVPILVNGQVVGVVGASGVHAEEDVRTAWIGVEGL